MVWIIVNLKWRYIKCRLRVITINHYLRAFILSPVFHFIQCRSSRIEKGVYIKRRISGIIIFNKVN